MNERIVESIMDTKSGFIIYTEKRK